MTHWKAGGHKRECKRLKAAAEAEKKSLLPKKKKEDDTNKEEAGGDRDGANDINETTATTTTTTATNTTTTTAAAATVVASSPVPPEDGKESTSAFTATTSSPPPRTYAENLTCCVCMDDLQVDADTFTRLTCCGKAMHKHCDEDVMKSKMSDAQKSRCPECRQKFGKQGTRGNANDC